MTALTIIPTCDITPDLDLSTVYTMEVQPLLKVDFMSTLARYTKEEIIQGVQLYGKVYLPNGQSAWMVNPNMDYPNTYAGIVAAFNGYWFHPAAIACL